MATTSPYFNPNWLKRQSRMNAPRAPRSADMNDPRDAATGMYNSGLQLDESGAPQPTRDFGSLLRLNSSQMNPLSRGVKPGSFSSLGQPMNSMYANNPGFFRSQIAQRNQSLTPGAPVMTREQKIAQAQKEGTFGTIRDKFNIDNEGAGLSMNEFGNIFKPKPTQKTPSGMPLDDSLIEKRGFGSPSKFTAAMGSRVSEPSDEMGRRSSEPDDTMGRRPLLSPEPKGISGPTTPQLSASQAANRAGLEERAGGLKLLREMSQTPLQTSVQDGGVNISGKYGSGWSAPVTPGKKSQGLINGRPASEVMQGLATSQVRQGTWREGDALPYEDQNDALDPNKIRRSVKDVTEENRQKILSRQRIAAKNR